jgi:hypothetical protein
MFDTSRRFVPSPQRAYPSVYSVCHWGGNSALRPPSTHLKVRKTKFQGGRLRSHARSSFRSHLEQGISNNRILFEAQGLRFVKRGALNLARWAAISANFTDSQGKTAASFEKTVVVHFLHPLPSGGRDERVHVVLSHYGDVSEISITRVPQGPW